MVRPTLLIAAAFVIFGAGFTGNSPADDLVPPARERFADKDVAETPDFQRHLTPLLGKLGCNGRSCHGSFQGAGGFQLSLFGYDFEMDHKGLLERIDLENPAQSYAIQKPTLVEPHEGGQRMAVGSWEYNLFLNWVKAGAKWTPEPAKLAALEVTPPEIQFTGPDQKQQLRAVAVWSDGTREDVTCLSRFRTNDDAVCNVDDDGLVTSADMGDSHVVVFYDNAVIPVPVIRPVSDQIGEKYPQIAGRTEIDRRVIEKLRKLGIVPADVCGDAEFLRRVCLDISGTLPTAAEVRAFIDDTSADKRARKVDELLSTPAYAAWWTTQLCDWTGCSDQQLNNVNPANRQRGSQDWYDWIQKRVADNVPYDKICEDIILANSRREGESYRDYCERMSGYARDPQASFADQEGLIYFWGRRNFLKTEDRAIGFAYTFMGTRIQCAQCHKHPFDVWTKKDFEQFEQFFTRINFAPNGAERDEYRALVEELGLQKLSGNDQRREIDKALKEGKTIPFPELVVQKPKISEEQRRRAAERKNADKNGSVPTQMARLLGEQEVDLNAVADPRTALMDWLRNSPTKLFAKAFVNRVWANYFNRGIVEPTDDLSQANPPCNEALMDYLVDGLIAHGYDMKWLHREICLSDTYQRSWKPNDTNRHDERNFSRAVPRRLPAEVAYDSLTMATANDAVNARFRTDLRGHAVTSTSPPRNAQRGQDYVLTIFGRSVRESNCDCDRSSDASLLQTLFTRNDNDLLQMLDRRDGWVSQLNGTTGPSEEDARKLQAAKQRLEQAEKAHAKAVKSEDEKQIETAKKRLKEAEQLVKSLQPKRAEAAPVAADQLIEEAYLRTLSRFPTAQEKEVASGYLQEAKDRASGTRDLLWALINTKEFMVNH